MKMFDFDGPVYKVGNEIADALILTLLWIVCSIPIITVGAATSSLFYIYGKKARDEDVYIMKDFFKSFKMNFVQSIPITIVLAIMWGSVYAYRLLLMGAKGQPSIVMSGVALFFTVEVTIISVYVLAVLSRFHMKVFNMFLTAFVLAHRHIVTTAALVAGIIILQYLSIAVPFLLFLTPILIAGVASVPIQKVFQKHIEASEAMENKSQESEVDDESDEDDEAYEDEDDEEQEVSEEQEEQEEDKDFLKYI